MTDIPLRWVGTDATGSAAASAKKNIESVGKAAGTSQGGVQGLDKAIGQMSGGLSGLGAIIGVGAIAALAGQAAGAVVEMAKASEASSMLRSSFDGLATTAGTTGSAIMASMKQASGGAISEYNLMLSANKAMMLGVASSGEEMAKLLEIATTRGRAMGLSTQQAFDNLVTGLGRGSALILDNLGIIVDADSVNKEYAASIGKTVAQLTEQEKKQALVNRTLQEATGKTAVVASSYERMAASMADMKVELGDLFAPALAATANLIADAIGAINDRIDIGVVAENAKQFDAAGSQVMQAWGAYRQQYEAELAKWNKASESFQLMYPGKDVGEFKPNLPDMPGSDNKLGMYWVTLKGQVEAYNEAAKKVGAPQFDLELMKRAQWETTETTHAINDLAEAQAKMAADLAAQYAAVAPLQAAYRGYAAMLGSVAQASASAGLSTGHTAQLVAQAAAQYDILVSKTTTAASTADELAAAQANAASQVASAMDRSVAALAAQEAAALASRASVANLHGAQVMASESATGLGVSLNFVRDAGWGAKSGIDAAGVAAVNAQSGFYGLVNAAVAASQAMRQAMMDSASNKLQGAYMGAVGTLGGARAYNQYQDAQKAQDAYAKRLDALGVPTEKAAFLLEEFNARVSDAVSTEVNATGASGRAAAGAAALAQKASGAAGKLADVASKAGDLSGKLQGILDQIPGLTGTSDVTEQQMADAKLGVPQNFADDYLRRLTDEVMNGVDWEGVDIGDAASRAGIDQSLPKETILAMFKSMWADSSLFANPANLDLINMDAVKSGITQQNNAASGKANIMALFGIGEDATVAAVAGLGLEIQSGLAQFLTDNGMADAGAKLAAAIGTGVTGAGIDLGGGLNTWSDSDAAASAAATVGSKLSPLLSAQTIITPTIAMPVLPGTLPNGGSAGPGGSDVAGGASASGWLGLPHNAAGTSWFGGGYSVVGEHGAELARLAPGAIYNARDTRRMIGGGVTVNAVINNNIDQARFERMLRDVLRKGSVRA